MNFGEGNCRLTPEFIGIDNAPGEASGGIKESLLHRLADRRLAYLADVFFNSSTRILPSE